MDYPKKRRLDEAARSSKTCSSRRTSSGRSRSRQSKQEQGKSSQSSSHPLAGFVDRMFCCNYSGDQVFMETAPEMEYYTTSVPDKAFTLDGSHLNGKALSQYPTIEKARELRSSSPTAYMFADEDDDQDDDDCVVSSPRLHMDFYRQGLHLHPQPLYSHRRDGGGCSTATTESMSTNDSLHSWNTLPTQLSDDSFLSMPEYVLSNVSPPQHRHHVRRSTDPQLAEKELLKQIRKAASSSASSPLKTTGHHPLRSPTAPSSQGYRVK